jgi:hypothetical protein
MSCRSAVQVLMKLTKQKAFKYVWVVTKQSMFKRLQNKTPKHLNFKVNKEGIEKDFKQRFEFSKQFKNCHRIPSKIVFCSTVFSFPFFFIINLFGRIHKTVCSASITQKLLFEYLEII